MHRFQYRNLPYLCFTDGGIKSTQNFMVFKTIQDYLIKAIYTFESTCFTILSNALNIFGELSIKKCVQGQYLQLTVTVIQIDKKPKPLPEIQVNQTNEQCQIDFKYPEMDFVHKYEEISHMLHCEPLYVGIFAA